MDTKPKAVHDYTYCVNKSCSQRFICARFYGNYKFNKKELYSFCKFKETTCIESENKVK